MSQFALIQSISSKEISEINKNTLKFGRVKSLIREYRNKKLQTSLFFCQYRNPYNNILIAWAAIEEKNEFLDLHIFVKKRYRKLKFGSKLAILSKKFQEVNFPNKQLGCSPYDETGKRFFEKHLIKNQKTILRELRS